MGPRHEPMDTPRAVVGAPGNASPASSDSATLPLGPSARVPVDHDKKEKPPKWRRSKRPFAAAVGMLAIILMLMVVGGIMLKYTLTEAANRISHLKLEDIISGKFLPKKFNASWIGDSDILYIDEGNNAILFDLYKLKGKSLTPNYHVIPSTSEYVEYQLSHNKYFLLAMHNKTQLPGQSPLAQYEVIDIQNQSSRPLEYIKEKSNKPDAIDKHLLQCALWSNRKSEILMVYHNDLYFQTVFKHQIRVSFSGVPGVIFNGLTDYLYRETILKSETAVWSSPNGQRVAYATFNDTLVHSAYIQYYGKPGSLDYQYPQNLEIRYPKAGTPLPTVTISVLDIDKLMQKRLSALYVPIPEVLANGDVLLTAVTWITNDEIAAVWMNRLQTDAVITVFDYDRGTHKDLLTIQADYGWLQPVAAPFFSPEDNSMVLITPQSEGAFSGNWSHVSYVQQTSRETIIKQLTRGKYAVKKIVAWDKVQKKIYFLATKEDSPSNQHLYSVSDNQWKAPNLPDCITCHMKNSEFGMPCLYNSASFNANSTFYMLNCEGPDIPEMTIFERSGRFVMTWENNHHIRQSLQKVGFLASSQYLSIDLGHGFKADVDVTIPPDYSPKRNKKYPLLIHLDGFPDSYPILEQFSVDWDDYITGTRNVVVAHMSVRGSGLRGTTIAHTIYKKIGTVEINDIIHVTKQLQKTYTFIDRTRTAIWGRHYGGYAATMALLKDKDNVFQCGVAVSPITEWLYYDAVIAERYMHLPTIQDNLGGYIDAGLTNKVENLRFKKFMLMYGTADSMVHPQHSMMLAKVLESNGIKFSQHVYPDEDLGAPGFTTHYFHLADSFLESCFREIDYD